MKRCYRFSGVEVMVSLPDERMYTAQYHAAPFATATVDDPYFFQFHVVDALPAPEGQLAGFGDGYLHYLYDDLRIRYLGAAPDDWECAYGRATYQGKECRVLLKKERFPREIGIKTVLNALWTEHLLAQNRGFLLHSACVAYHGKAVLFTAPSGVGKSTQAQLWQDYRNSIIVNGDRIGVRMTPEGVLAEGVPFCGSSQICHNVSLPLAAIVYLSQAPENSVRRLQGYEAFARIWEGCGISPWDKEDMKIVSDLVQKTAESVPVYAFACRPDESAVLALAEVLERQGVV